MRFWQRQVSTLVKRHNEAVYISPRFTKLVIYQNLKRACLHCPSETLFSGEHSADILSMFEVLSSFEALTSFRGFSADLASHATTPSAAWPAMLAVRFV